MALLQRDRPTPWPGNDYWTDTTTYRDEDMRLNLDVTTPFDVCQVGGAIDGNHFEPVTSHFKSFSHLYNSMSRVFAVDDGKSAVLGNAFLLPNKDTIHARTHLPLRV